MLSFTRRDVPLARETTLVLLGLLDLPDSHAKGMSLQFNGSRFGHAGLACRGIDVCPVFAKIIICNDITKSELRLKSEFALR